MKSKKKKKDKLEIIPNHTASLQMLNHDLSVGGSGTMAEDVGFVLREDDDINAAMELMLHNNQFQGEPYLGCFWYDPDKQETYGVGKSPARNLEWYFSKQFGKEIRTGSALHKDIWRKEQYRGRDNRFNGNFTKKPRGRVFEFKDDGFKVMTGSWINYYPEAKKEIIYEFDLPQDNTEFVIDCHWDLGHGWSDDFLEDYD